MTIVLSLIVFIVLAATTSYNLNKRVEYTLPLSAASISLIFFIFAFLNFRVVGMGIVFAACVASIGYAIRKRTIAKKPFLPTLQSPGLIFFVVMSIATLWFTRGFVFNEWDEFSHWGLVLKNIYLSNNFGNLDTSTTYFQSYPQGVSLFLSFFTQLSSQFREASALSAILILSYSQLAVVFIGMKLKDYKRVLLVGGTLAIAPLVFYGSFYATVYVDAIMGLIFANILMFHFTYKKRDLFYALYLSLQFYLLVNTKQIGIAFAALAFIAILLSNSTPFREILLKKNRRNLILACTPMVVGIVTNVTWKLYLNYHHITEAFQVNHFTLSDVKNLFSSQIIPYRQETILSFTGNMFGTHPFGVTTASYFILSLLFISLVVFIYYHQNKLLDRIADTVSLVTISVGFYIYAGLLLFMYLFAFWDVEARHTASFDRYLGSYLVSLLLLAIFMVVRRSTISHSSRTANLLLIITLVVTFSLAPVGNFFHQTVFASWGNRSRQNSRAAYQDAQAYTNALLRPDKDRVFIISQADDGEDYWRLRYTFTPTRVSPNYTWSLGKPYSSSDLYSKDWSPSVWSRELQNYTYVYIFHADDRFKSDYETLFESQSAIRDKTMYRIYSSQDRITLRRVNAIK